MTKIQKEDQKRYSGQEALEQRAANVFQCCTVNRKKGLDLQGVSMSTGSIHGTKKK